jgi:hypothetical protein
VKWSVYSPAGEVELKHVPTDRQVADIFTKALGLDKLRQFSGALGLRHLDVPNLRGREPEPEPELEPEPEPELEPEADRSEKAESESGVDSDMPNQPSLGQIRRTHRRRQDRDNKEAVKGRQDVNERVGCYRPEGRCRPKGR